MPSLLAPRRINNSEKPNLLGNPVLYAPLWYPKLRVASGGTFQSLDRTGHVCTVTGGVWGRDGWTADGDDRIVVPVVASLTANPTTRSAFVWVKANAADDKGVFAHWDDTGNQRGWIIYTDTAGGNKFRVLITSLGTWAVDTRKSYKSSIVAFDNLWHLIGFTWNSGTLKLFVDGVEDTNPTKTIDEAITDIYSSTSNLSLGCYFSTGVVAGSLTGTLGESFLFTRTLPGSEATNLYPKTKWRYG